MPQITQPPPLVSVVIPFLNGQRFLQEAIESVLNQTYARWELLLVDDGSTDRSTSIAREYARADPDRIRLLEHIGHANCGPSASRNLGIENGKGAYLAFLDADDLWLPSKLERQVALLEAHPDAGMVCGPLYFWYGWTGLPEDQTKDFLCGIGGVSDAMVTPPRLLLRQLETRDGFPGPGGVLIRRKTLMKVGGFEAEFRGLYEDEVFFSKIALTAPVYVMADFLDLYRQHPDARCAQAEGIGEYNPDPSTTNPERENFLRWLEVYLRNVGRTDPQLLRALRREMLPYRHPYLHRTLSRTRSWLAPNGSKDNAPDYPMLAWQRAKSAELNHLLELRKERLGRKDAWAAIAEVVHSWIPEANASVAAVIFGRDDLAYLESQGWLTFPEYNDVCCGQLLASGPKGSAEAPWIKTGFTYDFSLHRGTKPGPLLASARLYFSRGCLLTARPDPDTSDENTGRAAISWQTGNKSQGEVYVSENGAREVLVGIGETGNLEAIVNRDVASDVHLYAGEAAGEDIELLAAARVMGSGNACVTVSADSIPDLGLGNATITWNTGDGSQGMLYVTVDDDAPSRFPIHSFAAIELLEQCKDRGAEFLLFPRKAFWWFHQYPDFKQHLDANCSSRWERRDCVLYQLPHQN